jgi:hypothetical protein
MEMETMIYIYLLIAFNVGFLFGFVFRPSIKVNAGGKMYVINNPKGNAHEDSRGSSNQSGRSPWKVEA